jgi:hypothetical protein
MTELVGWVQDNNVHKFMAPAWWKIKHSDRDISFLRTPVYEIVARGTNMDEIIKKIHRYLILQKEIFNFVWSFRRTVTAGEFRKVFPDIAAIDKFEERFHSSPGTENNVFLEELIDLDRFIDYQNHHGNYHTNINDAEDMKDRRTIDLCHLN